VIACPSVSARFHLSFCVSDLEATRAFYVAVLGCQEGAARARAIDFSFFGHQLTCHLDPAHVRAADVDTLDGNHFGAIVAPEEFQPLAARLERAGARFIVPPQAQRQGTPGEPLEDDRRRPQRKRDRAQVLPRRVSPLRPRLIDWAGATC
jgi:uncharacterized protein